MSLWLDLLTLLLWHHARCTIRLDEHELHCFVLLGGLQVWVWHLLHHKLGLGHLVLVNNIVGHAVILALGSTIHRGSIVLQVLYVLP